MWLMMVNFTELPHILVVKDSKTLRFSVNSTFKDFNESDLGQVGIVSQSGKVVLRVQEEVIVPPHHVGNIKVTSSDFKGDAYVEASLHPTEGKDEYCVPRTILHLQADGVKSYFPVINLSH